ncbi:transmembrane channel-like protein 7 [Anabas testudineus]|uniref:Transmembrane channel-like protein n=1 Tax=Anabas testudineus TaxID=64144 RepID=A0AAQ6IIN7_ANATE|nr:transmembrane channel-like protein 7 [Anabas testudineus]
MEEHNSENFLRLISVESTGSTLSSDSCEYYQTEIFDQLPSVQASRPVQNRPTLVEPCEAYQGGPESEELRTGHLPRGQRDKVSVQPLKQLALCIQAKREASERRKMQLSNIGFWESWWKNQSIKRKRAWAQMGEALSGLLPWQHTLHVIEGKFGVGLKAYFVFFRYLVYLNLLHCIFICGLILGPTVFLKPNISELMKFRGNDSILDFFRGSGYLNRSLVFAGFYKQNIRLLNIRCLETTLLYIAAILSILILSLIMVVRRTTVGYKHTWVLGKRYNMNMSYKIFCGWDFTIKDPDAAILKSSFIRNDLKLLLEEQRFSLREAQRTLGQKVRLYLLRFILNMLVISLLSGAFFLIFFVTDWTLIKDNSLPENLFTEYLSPFTIASVNLVLPEIFRKISAFEDYSFTTQVNITLVRSIFLKLASLGFFFYSLLISPKKDKRLCTENEIGRGIYKMCIFNFLMTFCSALFFNYPRKLLQERYPTSFLGRLAGKQRFQIPFNVLELVNCQTVLWMGVYNCPLLPLIGTVILVATFYIKKFIVLRCCVAEQRLFRGSNSSVLFHFMLLLGLLLAASTLAFQLYETELGTNNMSYCGPFDNGQIVFNATAECMNSLPSAAQKSIHYLTSEAFALPLILAEIIILTSYVSRRQANQRAIERLKDMLVMSSSDKRFLVKQHATILRRRRNPRRVCAAATTDDHPLSHEVTFSRIN